MRIQKLIPVLSTAFILASAAATGHAATPPAPIVIYDNALQNDWQNWSWGATVTLSVPAGQVSPIKVEGTPWSALDFHHTAISTKGYTKLTFYINGGVDGGQQLAVKVKIPGGTSPDSTFVIAPQVKTWKVVEVPLKDIGALDKDIEDVFIQGQADAYKPYYITKIQIE